MNNMNNIQNILNKHLYQNHSSYISKYGIDIVITIIIIFMYSIFITYHYVKNHIPQIKKTWPMNKCNPLYMPFASLVLENNTQSSLKVIENNFNGCIENILQSTIQESLEPIYYIKSLTASITSELLESINSIRGFFNNFRNDITDTVQNISGRTLNVMIPPMQMAITTKDSLSKIKAIYTSGIYAMINIYLIIKSTILGIINIIISVVFISLVATIVALLFVPFFGWALAAIPIALAIGITIPIIPIIIKYNNIFQGNITTELPHW